MAFHDRWASGQLLSRATTDVSHGPPVRRLRRGVPGGQPDHLRRRPRPAAGHLLAAGPGRAAHHRAAVASSRCAGSGGTTCSPGGCRTSRASSPPTSRRRCRASAWSSRSAAAGWCSAGTTPRRPGCARLQLQKVRTLALLWCVFELHPQLTLALILVGGRVAVQHRRAHRRRPGRLRRAVHRAAVADPVAGLPVRLRAGDGQRLRPDRRAARRAEITVADRPGVRPADRRLPGPAALRGRRLHLPRVGRPRCSTASTSTSRPARPSPWSAPPARARPRSPRWSAGSTTSPAGRVTLDGVDVRDLPLAQLRAVVATAFEDADAVLDERPGEPHARPPGRHRRRGRRGAARRAGRVRARPAVGPGHPHRRAGPVAVRRAAAAARAGPRRARPAVGAGPGRPAVRPRRAHRGAGRAGAARGAGRHDGAGRRAPALHRAARRPGGAAGGRPDRRRRARTRELLARCPAYRDLLAQDSELVEAAP